MMVHLTKGIDTSSVQSITKSLYGRSGWVLLQKDSELNDFYFFMLHPDLLPHFVGICADKF
jgi:hypothetical protein